MGPSRSKVTKKNIATTRLVKQGVCMSDWSIGCPSLRSYLALPTRSTHQARAVSRHHDNITTGGE